MVYDAVILAGGFSSEELKRIAPYDNEALIIIGESPMILYVYRALRASPRVRRIVISGPVEKLRGIMPKDEELLFASGGGDVIESFNNAALLLESRGSSECILIAPTDIPFISAQAIDHFIDESTLIDGDFFYPLVSRQVIEESFPGSQRSYFHLREGVFTGGNLMLVRREIIARGLETASMLVRKRKDPLALVRMFGLHTALLYLIRQLDIAGAEAQFARIAGFKGKAVICPYAEIGVDVDKPADLRMAQQRLKIAEA